MTIPTQNPLEPLRDIIRPTSRGRLFLAILFALAVVLAVLFFAFALPFIKTTLRPAPPPHALLVIKSILGRLAALGTLSGFVAIWYGRRILRNVQYPPPGAWVWHDKRIVRGRPAIRFGWAHIVSGACTCALCIGLVAYAWTILAEFVPRHKLPEGVTILRENFSGKQR